MGNKKSPGKRLSKGGSGCCSDNSHARSHGELPLTVKVEIAKNIVDPDYLCSRSDDAVYGRKEESLIDEAERIQFMKRHGLTIPQIADRLGTHPQNALNRLRLLRLTAEEQQWAHTGRLGMVNALKLLKRRESGESSLETAGNDRHTHRKCMPSLTRAKALYNTVEKPADMPEEEWVLWTSADVRRFVTLHLGVEFTTFEEMEKAKTKYE